MSAMPPAHVVLMLSELQQTKFKGLIRRVRQSAKSDLDRQANAMLSRMRDVIGESAWQMQCLRQIISGADSFLRAAQWTTATRMWS